MVCVTCGGYSLWVNRKLRRDYPGTPELGTEVLKRMANRARSRMALWVGGPRRGVGEGMGLFLCRSDVAAVCGVSVFKGSFCFFLQFMVELRVLGNAHSARPVIVGSSVSESKIFNTNLSFSLYLIEYRANKYPYTTSTEHEPKQQRTARAGALMTHHPAWVGHHTVGSRSTPTVHPCRYDGLLWVAQQPQAHHNDKVESKPQTRSRDCGKT